MTDTKAFDIAVIGGGPGGYIAAIKAAQNGKQVCLIEKGSMGGVCLNVGCIPTKALLAHAKLIESIKKAEQFGVTVGSLSFDFSKMQSTREGIVEKLRKSLRSLVEANRITIIDGFAQFLSPKEIKITGKENLIITAEKSIIATGSEPADIPAFPCNHTTIFNSTSIFTLSSLPKTMVIVGGGYIGCEFATFFAALGVKVTILEALDSIVLQAGKSISDILARRLKKMGVEILTGVIVEKMEEQNDSLKIFLKDKEPLSADIALVSVGRTISTNGLGLEKAGVLTGTRKEIPVNNKMETSVPGIYAIGDVTGINMLAHVASHQGLVAADNACGMESTMHYDAVPAVIFTLPEIAMVGLTEAQAKEKGFAVTVGKYPFQALGKAVASLETEGFAQIVADQKTGQILGAQIIGEEASVLIAEPTLAIANELTLDSLTETIHAHPTLSEVWLEAALLAKGTPLHYPPIKR